MKAQKLKLQFQKSPRYDESGYTCEQYPNLRSYYFRNFSTKQEKSLSILHSLECKEMGVKVKIRSKRGKALPDSWDDFKATFHYVKNSWKHNSKRSSQQYKHSQKKRA